MSWLAAALAAALAVPGVVVAPAPDHNTVVAHRTLPRCTQHRRHHCTRHPRRPARQVAPTPRAFAPQPGAPTPTPPPGQPGVTVTPTATATATPAPPRRTSVTMDDTRDPWTLVPANFTLSSGRITLTAYDFGMDDHNLSVDSASRTVHYGSVDVPAGSADDDPPVLTVDLPPGRYVLFCDLPGHEAAGMASTITVQ